jgi:nucleotide-binding universal stress UspA family protein
MRILLATDGSDGALAAARFVAANFATDVEITLITVLRNPTEYFPDAAIAYNEPVWRDESAKYAHEVFTATRRALGDREVANEIFREGVPHSVLTEVAKNYDLVVVGKRRKPSLAKLVLGSVSQQLAHYLTVPLLIV